jgi:drug/metabolite transporter (DMT)-like permease
VAVLSPPVAHNSDTRPGTRTLALATGALVAFAANSVLARLALADGLTDAASYGSIRIISGAVALALIVGIRSARSISAGSWTSGFLLALYAAPFSFAYLQLTTGTGALILFGSVQATMISVGLIRGERPKSVEWVGLAIAVAGLVWFVLPGVDRAPLLGAALMLTAGTAWGFYSIRGKGSQAPLADTAGNFMRAVPLMLFVSLAAASSVEVTPIGVAYAVTSGVLASGLGYVAWYAALRGLTSTKAATIQLAVPVLAAWLGVILLGEPVTPRLALAGTTILAGIALATFGSMQST